MQKRRAQRRRTSRNRPAWTRSELLDLLNVAIAAAALLLEAVRLLF